jgi:hypothetical protein
MTQIPFTTFLANLTIDPGVFAGLLGFAAIAIALTAWLTAIPASGADKTKTGRPTRPARPLCLNRAAG